MIGTTEVKLAAIEVTVDGISKINALQHRVIDRAIKLLVENGLPLDEATLAVWGPDIEQLALITKQFKAVSEMTNGL